MIILIQSHQNEIKKDQKKWKSVEKTEMGQKLAKWTRLGDPYPLGGFIIRPSVLVVDCVSLNVHAIILHNKHLPFGLLLFSLDIAIYFTTSPYKIIQYPDSLP